MSDPIEEQTTQGGEALSSMASSMNKRKRKDYKESDENTQTHLEFNTLEDVEIDESKACLQVGKFNQGKVRRSIAEMFIIDELSFKLWNENDYTSRRLVWVKLEGTGHNKESQACVLVLMPSDNDVNRRLNMKVNGKVSCVWVFEDYSHPFMLTYPHTNDKFNWDSNLNHPYNVICDDLDESELEEAAFDLGLEDGSPANIREGVGLPHGNPCMEEEELEAHSILRKGNLDTEGVRNEVHAVNNVIDNYKEKQKSVNANLNNNQVVGQEGSVGPFQIQTSPWLLKKQPKS
nr:hypothetical protein [Tanacetum cinerariifolium]